MNDCTAARDLIQSLVPDTPARAAIEKTLAERASAKAAELRTQWHGEFDSPGREQWWLEYLTHSARAPKRVL